MSFDQLIHFGNELRVIVRQVIHFANIFVEVVQPIVMLSVFALMEEADQLPLTAGER